MFDRLLNSQAAQRGAARVVGAYLAFALRSTRWQVEGAEHLQPFIPDTPVILAFWHECLALMPAGWTMLRAGNPGRRGAVLISRHRDGRFIAAIVARFGIGIVHGSTARIVSNAGLQSADDAGAKPAAGTLRDKGGAAALRALVARLAAGEAVVVTPDGPRGPHRTPAPGIAVLAALSGAPVLPAAARLRRRIVLKTWDGTILPLPWGRGAIVCMAPLRIGRDEAEAGLLRLSLLLTEAADRAEALCRP